MKILRAIDFAILWTAFRNFLTVIGAVAIAAWFANQLRPFAMVCSVLWLFLILAVLYGIEYGREKRSDKAQDVARVDSKTGLLI